jgi:hypothetical protein
MKIVAISSQEALATAGQGTPSPGWLAEALRSEALARAVSSRAGLLRRVASRLCLREEQRPELEQTLDRLLRVGDLISGQGRRIAPAPVRLIELPDGGLILLGGVTSQALQDRFGEVISGVSPRRLSPERGTNWRAWGVDHGARWFRIEHWSRLSEAPSWERWLELLEARRFQEEFETRTILMEDDWQTLHCDPSNQLRPRRFRAKLPSRGWGLLRRREATYTSYALAWPEGGQVRGLRLTQDEARRTYCAVAASAGCPLTYRLEEQDGLLQLGVEPWLPRAEHLVLSLSDEFLGDRPPGTYCLPRARWQALAPMLTERIGWKKGSPCK